MSSIQARTQTFICNGWTQPGSPRATRYVLIHIVNSHRGEAKAWRGDPPTVAIAPDHAIYIGWTRKFADESAEGNDLVLSSSHDGGKTFGEPLKVNDDTKPESHGMHSLAVDRQGRVYLAWLDERNVVKPPHVMNMDGGAMHHDEAEPNSEVFYSYSADGGKTFAANKKISSDVCPCCKTSLLAAYDGTIYASWRQVLKEDHRHIAVAHSTDQGASFSAGVVVSNDNWQINACPVSGAAMASSASNAIDVVWYTAGAAGQAGIYFTRSTDGGKTFGDRILVSNEAGAGTPALLEQNGQTMAIFPATDGQAITATWTGTPTNALKVTKTGEATAPAAATGITAFVREGEGQNSVWLIAS